MWQIPLKIHGYWLASLLTLAGTTLCPALAAENPVAGRPMPGCKTSALGSSAAIELPAALRGKVVYVDFWASWCKPCAKAFPVLDTWQREFADSGFHVVGISVDESPVDALNFLDRHPVSFVTVNDPTGNCPKAFGVTGMPSSYLVDRAGIIRQVHTGFRGNDIAERRHQIELLLAESPASR